MILTEDAQGTPTGTRCPCGYLGSQLTTAAAQEGNWGQNKVTGAWSRREGAYMRIFPTWFPDPEVIFVVFSSTGWEFRSSGLSSYRFFWRLCRIATLRLSTVVGSRCLEEGSLALRCAQRTASANWMPWRASLS